MQPSEIENAEQDESTVLAVTVDLQPMTMYQPINESPSEEGKVIGYGIELNQRVMVQWLVFPCI